jgi:hypothetical protein
VFGVIAAVLFGLFVVGGAITLLNSLPRHSCSGVAPTNYSGDTVQLAGSGWPSIPANHCVEVISVQVAQANKLTVGNGYDLGPAPGIHTGTAWNYARLGIGAWIAWTLAMVMLALAVAALPGRSGGGHRGSRACPRGEVT